MAYNFRKVPTIVIFLLSLIESSCFSNISGNQSDLDKFENDLKEANISIVNKDYNEAEKRTLSALKIAERIKWEKGIINTKLRLSKLYAGDKNLVKAEELLNQLEAMCNDGSCSADDLGNIYDDLFLLYLNGFKDISKAENVVDKVISSQQKLSSNQNMKERLNQYVVYMKHFGYEKEADVLYTRIKSMQ